MSEQVEPTTATQRGPLLWLAIVLLLAGAGRLVMDEVRLAQQSTRLEELTQVETTTTDLDKDLKRARARAAMLKVELKQARARVASANDDVVKAESELRRLKQRTNTTSGALDAAEAKAAAARARVKKAEAQLGTVKGQLAKVQALALEEARRAEAAERLVAQRTAQVKAAKARADLAQKKADEAAASLARTQEALTQAQAALTKAQARARAVEATVGKLKSAGVNVERLSGKRPMPVINAIVVQVDATNTPPAVMVNAGKANGLEPKDILFVLRGGREVARLEVDEVNDYLSTTRVVRSVRGVTLRPSDTVVSIAPKRP